MKISESWLREWVDPPLSSTELAAQLTQAGLEIEAVEPAAPPFTGVIVAEILTVAPHPQADKLRICQVNTGETVLAVVCGAANARAGLRAPLAQVGAQLPGGQRIQAAHLRGVASAGMLCSAVELGLAEAAQGLWELPADAPVGLDLRAWLGLEDSVFALKITPNRGDCLSVRGLARELSALNTLPLRVPDMTPVPEMAPAHIQVHLDAPAACPHYVGRRIRKVRAQAPSPLWLVERLRRAGMRSHGILVDVTNYLLLEQGQPLHAFDAARIQGDVRVRWAQVGETATLLNGQTVTLAEDMLVIADAAQVLALAGIMGGAGSAVTAETQDVFLESAFFSPQAIRGRARRLGLQTDASYRFERGIDPAHTRAVLERATALIVALAGGEVDALVEVMAPAHWPTVPDIPLRAAQWERLLGFTLPVEQARAYLERLGCRVMVQADGWVVQPPAYRFDLQQSADLIEEIARLHGYDRIPSQPLRPRLRLQSKDVGQMRLEQARQRLVALGYQEVISYSFVDPGLQRALDPDTPALPLANPISAELAVMRTTVWCGLIQALRANLSRQQIRGQLFEMGLCFRPGADGLSQPLHLGGLIWGSLWPEQWGAAARPGDFYDLKGDVEALLAALVPDLAVSYQPATHPALHPGQSAALHHQQQVLGQVGLLHPRLARQLDLPEGVGLFELVLTQLPPASQPRHQAISRFPAVRRDVALIIAARVPAAQVLATARAAAGPLLRELCLFDHYQGNGIPENHKSLALGLTFQAQEQTLTDDIIDKATQSVVYALEVTFQAKQRIT